MRWSTPLDVAGSLIASDYELINPLGEVLTPRGHPRRRRRRRRRLPV